MSVVGGHPSAVRTLGASAALDAISCLVALTGAALGVVKRLVNYGPISLQADPYDRYTVSASFICMERCQQVVSTISFQQALGVNHRWQRDRMQGLPRIFQ